MASSWRGFLGADCSSPLSEVTGVGGGQSRAWMPSCHPAFPRLWCQHVNGEVQGAWGPGLPFILQLGPWPKS